LGLEQLFGGRTPTGYLDDQEGMNEEFICKPWNCKDCNYFFLMFSIPRPLFVFCLFHQVKGRILKAGLNGSIFSRGQKTTNMATRDGSTTRPRPSKPMMDPWDERYLPTLMVDFFWDQDKHTSLDESWDICDMSGDPENVKYGKFWISWKGCVGICRFSN